MSTERNFCKVMDRTKLDKYPKVRYFVGTQKKSINFYDNKIVMF